MAGKGRRRRRKKGSAEVKGKKVWYGSQVRKQEESTAKVTGRNIDNRIKNQQIYRCRIGRIDWYHDII
jgi:hypothetical protein